MDADDAAWQRRSMVRVVPTARPRKLAKVPFVEMADGRLQGVVSSGSDIGRVYVSSVAAGSYEVSCSTNNNRPCGGLRGGDYACNHLTALADEAIVQYGGDRVARFLRLETNDEVTIGNEIFWAIGRTTLASTSPAAAVFSRFLHHLSYLDLPGAVEPLPELSWFPAGAGAR